jgi:hypothetical protein
MPRSLSTAASASGDDRRPTPRYMTSPSPVTSVARSCCCSDANRAGKCWRLVIDSFGAWNFVATSIDAHSKPSSCTTIVAPTRAGDSQCTARSSIPWATAGSRSGAAWRRAFSRAAAVGRSVQRCPSHEMTRRSANRRTCPNTAVRWMMRAPVVSCRCTSSASYCTGRSKHTSTGESSWRLTMNAERPSANVRAISRGRPSSSMTSAIPPAVEMLIPGGMQNEP